MSWSVTAVSSEAGGYGHTGASPELAAFSEAERDQFETVEEQAKTTAARLGIVNFELKMSGHAPPSGTTGLRSFGYILHEKDPSAEERADGVEEDDTVEEGSDPPRESGTHSGPDGEGTAGRTD